MKLNLHVAKNMPFQRMQWIKASTQSGIISERSPKMMRLSIIARDSRRVCSVGKKPTKLPTSQL